MDCGWEDGIIRAVAEEGDGSVFEIELARTGRLGHLLPQAARQTFENVPEEQVCLKVYDAKNSLGQSVHTAFRVVAGAYLDSAPRRRQLAGVRPRQVLDDDDEALAVEDDDEVMVYYYAFFYDGANPYVVALDPAEV